MGGTIAISVIVKFSVPIDVFSFAILLFNFTVVGVMSVFAEGVAIPIVLRQVYMVCLGIIVAAWFTGLPEWSTWSLLVALAVYDLVAVLAPGGPLKILVELASSRDDDLPALVYEARPTVNRSGGRGGLGFLVGGVSSDQVEVGIEMSRRDGGGGGDTGDESDETGETSPLVANVRDGVRSSYSGSSERSRGHEIVENEEGTPLSAMLGMEMESRSGDVHEEEMTKGIKLGLGDFVFYSVLVGRAAMYDLMTVYACYLAIISGLGCTLILLSVFRQALPALPISIALGIMFYFLTRVLMEPFVTSIFVGVYVRKDHELEGALPYWKEPFRRTRQVLANILIKFHNEHNHGKRTFLSDFNSTSVNQVQKKDQCLLVRFVEDFHFCLDICLHESLFPGKKELKSTIVSVINRLRLLEVVTTTQILGVMVFTRDTSLDVGVDKVFDELSVNKFLKRRCTVKEYYDAFTSSFNNQGLDEGYLIDLFVFGLQPEIEKRLKWVKPRSLSDAYSLAKLEETIHDLLKTKISSSSLHLSEAKDYSEVRNENFGLEGIDGVCEAAGKNRELESNESRIVDVKGVVNCEDGKGHGSESSGVVDNNIDLHNHGEEGIGNKEVRVLVDFGCGESGKNMICSDRNKEVMDVVNEFQGSVKEGENGLETVIDKLVSKNGESLSPDKKLDACIEDQFMNYEKHTESLVRNRKECDGEQEGNKEDGEWVLSVHLFGKCHDLRLIGNQEWMNEGGDIDIDIDIRGLNVNGFLAYIRDGDDLLNRQKKQKGDVVQFDMLEWPKMKKASHVNFKFKSRSWKFDTWKWRKRKKVGGTECIFRHKKGNGDIWKWPLRKKERLESYTRLVEAKRALFRGEQHTSRPGSNVRRSSGGKPQLHSRFQSFSPNVLAPSELESLLKRGCQVIVDGNCKEGMRALDKCWVLNTGCWFKKDVPRLCIEKYLKMFCKDAKESGVSIVSLNFEHGKWKFDVWRWPNRKKKWEETCYGVCLPSPTVLKYMLQLNIEGTEGPTDFWFRGAHLETEAEA
ncbi:presenilin-like protein [Tanacetum coccineum]